MTSGVRATDTLGTRLDQAILTAAAAWSLYASTVHTGGTPAERQWRFTQAVNADQRAADLKRKARA